MLVVCIGLYGFGTYTMDRKSVSISATFTKAEIARMRKDVPLKLPSSTIFRMEGSYDKGWDWFLLMHFRVPKRDLAHVLESPKLRNHRWKPTADAAIYYRHMTGRDIPKAGEARSVDFRGGQGRAFTLTFVQPNSEVGEFYLVEF